ncbi:hypothetical protein BDW71DRAFT_13862 [Aspergillus fruticulosus]
MAEIIGRSTASDLPCFCSLLFSYSNPVLGLPFPSSANGPDRGGSWREYPYVTFLFHWPQPASTAHLFMQMDQPSGSPSRRS